MKEYQQKRMKEFLMPEAVFRQALWAVRDMPRIMERIKEVSEQAETMPSGGIVMESRNTGAYSDRTGRTAVELARLSTRMEAVENAFNSIPEKYREGLRQKLFYGNKFSDDFHPNTWKKWQQVYLYNVAANLGLY